MGQSAQLARLFLAHYGLVALFVLLTIEEAGVWLPVPGDVFVMYYGYQASRAPVPVVAALPALAVVTVAVTCGATVLYLVTRRYRRRVLRLGRLVHLNERRLQWMEGRVQRYGMRAIIPGRLIPGLRIPTTAASGLFGLAPARFIPAAAVGGAVWATLYLVLGGMGQAILNTGARTDIDAPMPDEPLDWLVMLLALTVILLLVAVFTARRRPGRKAM